MFFLICVFGIMALSTESAKILTVISNPSISHQIVFRPLTQELAKRGHEVVVVTTDPAFLKGQAPENLTEIDVHEESYEIFRARFISTVIGVKENQAKLLNQIYDSAPVIFEAQMQNKEFQDLIQNKSFDLLLLEACVVPLIVLQYVFKAPVIQISSFGSNKNYALVGAPEHCLLYPDMWSVKIQNLTFWEKVTAIFDCHALNNAYYSHYEDYTKMMRQNFGDDVPSVNELNSNVDMLFLNMHSAFGAARPEPPSVVHIWGMNQQVTEKLPQDLTQYLNSSKNGVIYVSFGTNIRPRSFSREKLKAILNVLSQLPYDVLLKWDEDELLGRPANFKIGKWFPQKNLLRHPKIKLFIMQGGLQSTEEAIDAGVPLVGIPFMLDQWYNTEIYVHYKIGTQVEFETLTEEILSHAIQMVLTDESYRHNIAKLRSILHDVPRRALDNAVWWIEHVLQHGAVHLRAPAANMSSVEYYELELFLILFLGLVTVLFTIITILRHVYKCFMQKYSHNDICTK